MPELEQDPPKRRRGITYAIVSADVWTNPKVCKAISKAGPLAALVWIFALTRNAAHGRTGVFPASEFEAWYIARQLGASEADAERAIVACSDVRLTLHDGDQIQIVGWSEDWKRADLTAAETERKRAYRLKISTAATSDSADQKRSDQKEEQNRDVPDKSRTSAGQVPLGPELSRSKRKAKAKPDSPTELELASVRTVLGKLTARNGVAYQGSKEHTRLIVARLREGYSEMDLRGVIGYCATELGWRDKPDMLPYLRPETLFGPETFTRYVEPARAWLAKLPRDRDGQKRAGATIHVLPLPRDPGPANVPQIERQGAQAMLGDAIASLFPNLEASNDE